MVSDYCLLVVWPPPPLDLPRPILLSVSDLPRLETIRGGGGSGLHLTRNKSWRQDDFSSPAPAARAQPNEWRGPGWHLLWTSVRLWSCLLVSLSLFLISIYAYETAAAAAATITQALNTGILGVAYLGGAVGWRSEKGSRYSCITATRPAKQLL